MKNRLSLMSWIFFLALTASAATADASDGKAHMAAFCREQSGTATFGSNGEIFNASTTQSLTLECAIVRDQLDDPLLSVNVLIRDRGLNDDISCRVRTRAPSGSTLSSALYSTSGADASGSFDTLPMLVELWLVGIPFNPADDAALMLVCTLPPADSASSSDRSAMFTYLVTESS